jgi:metallo-beta-lactamase class B
MRRLFSFFALFLALSARGQINPEWTTTLPPFQIADNLYYVGSQDLAAYLVTTPAGNILINANLETSPPQIRASVEKLGFRRPGVSPVIEETARARGVKNQPSRIPL